MQKSMKDRYLGIVMRKASEKSALRIIAAEAGMNMSDYARMKLHEAIPELAERARAIEHKVGKLPVVIGTESQ